MTPVSRIDIFRGLDAMCRLFPSYRLRQMVANVGTVAQSGVGHDLTVVTDEAFLDTMQEVIRQRREMIGHDPVDARALADPHDSWTLPPLLPQIIRGLEELSAQYPDKPFVPLVLQVAEWTKEFAPFDFWDVEDADFLRAIESHRPVQTA
jgi:hypothetical protein